MIRERKCALSLEEEGMLLQWLGLPDLIKLGLWILLLLSALLVSIGIAQRWEQRKLK